MTAAEMQEHAAKTLQAFGFKPAGSEWLSALLKAQKNARQIERHKGIPDKFGKIKFHVAPAEDFTNEGRRCLHPEGMGWFRVSTRIIELNPHMGTLKLTSCYLAFHEPTGQAQACYVDWSAKADGDAMASSHTRVARRFLQDLLCIPVVDEGIVPDEPPRTPGCDHPTDRHVVHPDCSVVCSLCSEFLGYSQAPPPQQQAMFQAGNPPPQPPVPPQQQMAPPPQQLPPPQFANPPMDPQAAPQQAAPPQQQQQAPRTPLQDANYQEIGQHQGSATGEPFPGPPNGPRAETMDQLQQPPPQQPNGLGVAMGGGVLPPGPPQQPTGPLPPIQDSLVVQEAQKILEAEPITQAQMNAERSAPLETATPPGEPATPDEWRAVLVGNGMDEDNAMQIALLSDPAIVEPSLVEDMRNWAWSHYAGDAAAMNTAWISVGFTPVVGLPIDQRPRPTGIQTKRFLANMKFAPK